LAIPEIINISEGFRIMAVKGKRYYLEFTFRDENDEAVRLYRKLSLKVAQELGHLPRKGELFTILIKRLATHEDVTL
jgi:hypothetical protein